MRKRREATALAAVRRPALAIIAVLGSTGLVAAGEAIPKEPPIPREVVASGVVFMDRNANGKRDAGEPPLAGVVVSDGERVHVTKADGAYQFAFHVKDFRFIHISCPSGYRPTSSWHRIISKVRPETEYHFDFALAEDPGSRNPNYSFLVTADSQFRSKSEGEMLRQEFAQISRASGKPAFHVICGDLTMTGWLEEWQYYDNARKAMRLRHFDVFGGHGGNYGRRLSPRRYGIEHFNIFCGPSFYSWNYGGRHFVVYNSVASGYMSPDAVARQGKWLKADMAAVPKGSEVVFFAHYSHAFDEYRQDYKVRALFYGHHHQNGAFHYKGTPHLVLNPMRGRDWGAFTRAYRVCRFQGGELATEIRVTGQYQRLRIVWPAGETPIGRGRLPVHVMAYDSATVVVRAQCRIVGPSGESRVQLKKAGQWAWRGTWNAETVRPGAYQVHVKVTDDIGRTWERRSKFEVGAHARPAVEVGEDWPFLLKSHAELRSIADTLSPPLELVWVSPTGGQAMMACSPIVYQGRVYIGVQNDNAGCPGAGVVCFDAATGKRLWHGRTDASIKYGIAADGGRIFAQSSYGTMYAFDARTGAQQWEKNLYGAPSAGHRMCIFPVMPNNGIVYGGTSGGLLVGYDMGTGKERIRISSELIGNRYAGGAAFRGRVVYETSRNGTAALDLATGEPVWTNPAVKQRGVGTPVVAEDRLVLNLRQAVVLDANTGRRLWNASAATDGFGCSCPTVAHGVVYLGGSDLHAFELSSGRRLWTFKRGFTKEESKRSRRQVIGGMSSPLVAGDVVYAGGDDGRLYALHRRSGKKIWSHTIGVPLQSSPVVSGNALFVADYDGNLYAFGARRR